MFFYLNTFATAQKLFVWSLIAGYIVLNNKIASKIINRIVFGYLKKKNVIFLLLLWGIISVYSITPFSQILSEVILKKGINIEFRAFFCQLYHEWCGEMRPISKCNLNRCKLFCKSDSKTLHLFPLKWCDFFVSALVLSCWVDTKIEMNHCVFAMVHFLFMRKKKHNILIYLLDDSGSFISQFSTANSSIMPIISFRERLVSAASFSSWPYISSFILIEKTLYPSSPFRPDFLVISSFFAITVTYDIYYNLTSAHTVCYVLC